MRTNRKRGDEQPANQERPDKKKGRYLVVYKAMPLTGKTSLQTTVRERARTTVNSAISKEASHSAPVIRY